MRVAASALCLFLVVVASTWLVPCTYAMLTFNLNFTAPSDESPLAFSPSIDSIVFSSDLLYLIVDQRGHTSRIFAYSYRNESSSNSMEIQAEASLQRSCVTSSLFASASSEVYAYCWVSSKDIEKTVFYRFSSNLTLLASGTLTGAYNPIVYQSKYDRFLTFNWGGSGPVNLYSVIFSSSSDVTLTPVLNNIGNQSSWVPDQAILSPDEDQLILHIVGNWFATLGSVKFLADGNVSTVHFVAPFVSYYVAAFAPKIGEHHGVLAYECTTAFQAPCVTLQAYDFSEFEARFCFHACRHPSHPHFLCRSLVHRSPASPIGQLHSSFHFSRHKAQTSFTLAPNWRSLKLARTTACFWLT